MKRADVAALVLAVLGSVLSIWVANSVYEGLPHLEDEFAFLWEAEVMAGGRIKLPSPFEARSHLVPFVVDYEGYRFGKYPPGWPAALSLGARLGVPWAVNALLAGFSLWMIYRLGSKVAGKGVGVLAAALSLTSPMFLMLSGSLLSHTFSLFLTCAFALAWLEIFPLKVVEEGGKRIPAWVLILILGNSLGLLAITRPLTAVGVGLPFIVLGVGKFIRGKGVERKQLVGIGVLTLLLVALLPLWNAALTGDPVLNPYTLWWEYDRIGFGPGVGVTEMGHNLTLAWWNMKWSLRTGVHDLFGWPYLSWVFIPLGLIALRRKREGWLLLLLFPSLVLVYMAYWVGAWLYGPRYYFEAIPGLVIASAAGILWLGGWLTEDARFGRARKVIVGVLVLVMLFLNLAFYLPPRLTMMSRLNNMSREHHRPFEEANFERTLVIVHPTEIWTEYGTLLTLTPPFAESEFILVYSRGPTPDARLAAMYGGWTVLHYYPNEPFVFYRNPKPSIIIEK